MRPSALRRAGMLAALATLVVSLAACSGDDAGADPTTTTPASPTATMEPSSSPSATRTPTQGTDTSAGTSTPDETATDAPGDVPTAGGGAEDLRAFLPVGFPVPEMLTITGDPTATEDNFNVTFTVPDAVAAFEFFKTELPEAGYEILPGSSDSYSTDVSSGALLAQDDDFKVNLLIVDNEVEITITPRG